MASSLNLYGKIKRLRRQREELQSQRSVPRFTRSELPGIADVPLLELIPRLSPKFIAPVHLSPLVDEAELMIAPHAGQRFFWLSVPPGHYKTGTLRHVMLKHLARWPADPIVYISHSQDFASEQSRELRKMAEAMSWGFRRDSNRQDEWELLSGAKFKARGIGNIPAGVRARLMVIDDPIRGREVANSPLERAKIFAAIEDDAMPRLLPDGCLVLVHTRWHPDDPIGRYQKRAGWRGVNIPALSGPEENIPLVPEIASFEHLDRIRRANVVKFDALYQGRPRSRDTELFSDPKRYRYPDELPGNGYRLAYGVDLACTAKTTADFSVCIKLVEHQGIFYVADVIRRQVQAPSFALALRAAYSHEPGPMLWLFAGMEKGAGQFIQEKLPYFRMLPATVDKVVRSEPMREAWNLGNVRIPGGDNAPGWADELLDECLAFTGLPGGKDDQVDALAAAFGLLAKRAPIQPPDSASPPLSRWDGFDGRGF